MILEVERAYIGYSRGGEVTLAHPLGCVVSFQTSEGISHERGSALLVSAERRPPLGASNTVSLREHVRRRLGSHRPL